MTNSEDLINRLFAWIVEDPFYSPTHERMVKVDDFDNLLYGEEFEDVIVSEMDDDFIKMLYTEWFNYNCNFSDFLAHCKAPNPDSI